MKHLFLFWALLACVQIGWSQSLMSQQKADLDRVIHAQVDEGAPGVAVGVVAGGKIIYETYAGLADLKSEAPLDATHRFNYASVGKQFTALCILKLAEEGKLKLTDDVRKYVPWLLPDISETISLAHLLNHTSGIRDVYNLWSLQGIVWWKSYLDNDDAFELLRGQRALNFAPGSRHLYSNSNYILLTEVVAQAAGKPFVEYSRGLFREMGLSDLTFEPDPKAIANVARPYFDFGSWYGYKWKGGLVGDGALFGTLRDGLNYEVALQTVKADDPLGNVLGMSQRPIPGMDYTEYGFGLEFSDLRGKPYRYHEGSTGAWKASVIRVDNPAFAVLVLSNSGAVSPSRLSRTCTDILLGRSPATGGFPSGPDELGAPLPVADLPGTYKTDAGYYYRFLAAGDTLILQRLGRDDIRCVREADNLYHQVDDPDFKQHFSYDPERGYRVTVYYWSHAPYSLDQVKSEWAGYDFAAVEGIWENDETDSRAEIRREAGDRFTVKSGGNDLRAWMVEPDVMIVEGFRLDFYRSSDGTISRMGLFDSRLQNVEFQKVK